MNYHYPVQLRGGFTDTAAPMVFMALAFAAGFWFGREATKRQIRDKLEGVL